MSSANLYKDDVHTLARWSVIPYVGVGMLHNKVNAHKPFAISYGIQGQYHLSPRIAVTAEIGNMTTMQDFDGYGKAHRLATICCPHPRPLCPHRQDWLEASDRRSPVHRTDEWLSAYASSLSDSNSRYHAQHDRDCQTLEQLRKILAIEGLLDKYGHLFSDDAASSVTNGYPRNDYSGLNSLRARMRDKYGNGQKTKVMESASCTEEYGNAEVRIGSILRNDPGNQRHFV